MSSPFKPLTLSNSSHEAEKCRRFRISVKQNNKESGIRANPTGSKNKTYRHHLLGLSSSITCKEKNIRKFNRNLLIVISDYYNTWR